jgi:aminomethyltransferase
VPIPTPFHSRTGPLCESHEWRNWSGYLAAGTYEPSHEREYFAIRNSAALIDISPLFKYDISGPDALQLANKTITRDLSKSEVGQIIYSPWCDEQGKIIDDGTVWRLDEQHFRVTAADPNLRWLQDCGFGLDATVADQSRNLAALAIQGPLSGKIISSVVDGIGINEIQHYWLAGGKVGPSDVTVTRTGYTGDQGYELWVSPQYAELLWDRLIDAGAPYGLLPAGMVALDIARIEAGLLLIEVDYISSHRAITEARKSSPYEAGLGWTVALEKGPFIGRPALAREKDSEQRWSLVGLEIDWPMLERKFAEQDLPPMVAGRASRSSVPLYNSNERQVGYVTSSTFSPVLKKYIGLATVESAFSKKGTDLQMEITVEFSRQKVRANVVKIPFYEPAWKKGNK